MSPKFIGFSTPSVLTLALESILRCIDVLTLNCFSFLVIKFSYQGSCFRILKKNILLLHKKTDYTKGIPNHDYFILETVYCTQATFQVHCNYVNISLNSGNKSQAGSTWIAHLGTSKERFVTTKTNRRLPLCHQG